jgi:hypothetical protein
MVVVVVVLEGVQDAVGDLVGGVRDTLTERVVVALFVVISHIKAVTATLRLFDRAGLDYLDFLVEADRLTLGSVGGVELPWTGALVFPGARSTVLLGEWGGAVAVFALGNVDASVVTDVRGLTVGAFAVVDTVLDVDLCLGVPLERFTVTEGEVGSATLDHTSGKARWMDDEVQEEEKSPND